MEQRVYTVKVAADNWQERQFAGYCGVIAYLAKFGIAAPSPKVGGKIGWLASQTNRYRIRYAAAGRDFLK